MLASVWDYLDGKCSSEVAQRIDAHFAACVECLRLRRAQEHFFAALAELRTRSLAPRQVHNRVRTALATERRRSYRR